MSSVCLHKYFLANERETPISQWRPDFLKTGKSVYEVIRVIHDVPLFLEDHLERFNHSLDLTGINSFLSDSEIKSLLLKLIKLNHVSVGNIMFVLHLPDKNEQPDFYAWFIPHSYPTDKDYREGVRLLLFHAERQNRQAKVLNMDMRKAISDKISESGVYEALLVDREDCITEGSKSNFFSVSNNEVYTAPAKDVLSGITRKYIFRICNEKRIPLREEKVSVRQLEEMDACFITGTSPKVLPVARIDSFGFNPEHPILRIIMDDYNRIIGDYINARWST